jgi:hypothetical protein
VQVVRRGRGERERRRLDEAGRGERVRDAATPLLQRRETAAGGRRRQHRRNAVEAVDARHLLGQRPAVGEVGAPRRRDDLPPGIRALERCDLAPDRLERAGDLGIRVVDADELETNPRGSSIASTKTSP